MKVLTFSVNREEFLQGLSRVQNIVERKNTVPILSNVLIDGTGDRLRMLATDMEVGVSGFVAASIKGKGAITLSARKLFEIIKELPPESKITLQVKDNNLSEITSGTSSFELKGLPAEDYPNLPAYEEGGFLTLNAGNFRDMIKKTIYAASTDETRYNLTGILFEMEEKEGKGVLRLVATDGHRLAMVEKQALGNIRPGESVVIPRKSLNEVRRLLEEGDDEMVEVDFQKQHGVFRRDSVVLTTRLIDMSFPNYSQVVPEGGGPTAQVDREAMIHAIRRVSLLSSERSRAIRFSFGGSSLTIHINNPDLGTATETVPMKYAGEDMEVTFNARYMLDTLTSMDSETIQVGLKDELSPCTISPKGEEDYLAVIMPMRI
ncbi:MAG: DNA polymerase III subunit beta [bacterium]|nr:MAG: DNA polymerase III subunit beta [bacterium]